MTTAENDAGRTFEVTPTTLVYGGEALGRLPDGRAVFIPFCLPAETVVIRLVEEKRNFARAELLEVIAPAPTRIEPRCDHFGVCGGCHYQHMPYAEQLEAKAAILADQLERIGGMSDPSVEPAVPSPDPFYYRNHVQFHLTPDGALGYHEARSETVFAIHECHLPEEPLNEIWPLLEIEPVPGLARVHLRLGEEDVLMALESEDPEPPEFAVDVPLSAVHLGPEGPTVMSGGDHVWMELLGRSFRVTAGSFFQVNSALAASLVEHVLDGLSLNVETTAFDVHAGVGLFSAFLAPRVGYVVAVESNPVACDDFEVNMADFENVTLYQGRAEHVLPDLEDRPDVVVVDPPRAGLARPTLDALVDLRPSCLAYVSCDPATLARDAKRLTRAGYRLRQVTPFDLFPQTFHIESVSFWEMP